MNKPREALSSQGIIFVSGVLSTHDNGKRCKVIGYCLGLTEDTSRFKEFFADTIGVAGTWVIEVINYESQGVSFYHEVVIDGVKYFIPSHRISFDF